MRKLLLPFCLAALSSAAVAHQGATGIVFERMELMKTMEADLKAIVRLLKDEKPIDATALQAHAEALHMACHEVGGMFPPGSNDMHSHAEHAVWERPREFAALMKRLHQASKKLVSLSGTPADREQVFKATKVLGGVCRECHETFRKAQD